MKNNLIKITEREGLQYQILQELKYFFGKATNAHNFLLRKERIRKFLKNNNIIKIQFGAGSGKLGEAKISPLKNFLNTDIFGHIPIDINSNLPFKKDTVDIIFSSHLIEHIFQRKADLFFKESYRVLKNKGNLIIATPTIEKMVEILYGKNIKFKNQIYSEHLNSFLGRPPTPARLINAMTHINYGHKFLFDFETLKDLAIKNGFTIFDKVTINNVKDSDIRNYLKSKNHNYKLQTEIFLAIK